MSFSTGYPYTSTPYTTGTTSSIASPDVPGLYDVALNGVGYFLDTAEPDFLIERSAPRIRQQGDTGRSGENTLNPDGAWIRASESWHLGAGQIDADRDDSVAGRYHTSKGVNVWDRWALTLLPASVEARLPATTSNNLYLATAGSRLYQTDDQTVVFTNDAFDLETTPSWTACTGTPAIAATGIASAGHHIFVAFGTSGIYHTEIDTGAMTSWATGTVEGVWYVKGRIMTCAGGAVYNPVASWTAGPTALPTALYTHPNDAWTWVDMAEGLNDIYMGGYAGDTSLIYRTAVKEDGTPTALDVPVVCGRLPEGEIITALDAYLGGFVLIGTDKGVRIATSDSAGNLQLGALIETGSAVRDFEGQGQYVWFTWEAFDNTDGGLGRIDLTQTTQNGAPAYASDLMVASTGAVQNVTTFNDRQVFTVAGLGTFAGGPDLVSEGYVTTGRFRFGLTDPKIGLKVNAAFDVSAGSVDVQVETTPTSGTFDSIGIATTGSTAEYALTDQRVSWFNIKARLVRDDTDATTGPTVERLSVRALPTSRTTQFITARLLFADHHMLMSGTIEEDVAAARDAIAELHRSNAVVAWQDMAGSRSVVVEDYGFAAGVPTRDREAWNGTMDVRLKVVT